MAKKKLLNQIVPGLNGRLRQERERLGLSQQELADLLGISRVSQNNYENGTREPGLDYLTAFGQNNGDIQFILFADHADHEYVDIIDWELFAKVWKWVEEVCIDAKGKPYPLDLKVKAFRLAYKACRTCEITKLEDTDLVSVLGMAA